MNFSDANQTPGSPVALHFLDANHSTATIG
jgi:hypothetical protein